MITRSFKEALENQRPLLGDDTLLDVYFKRSLRQFNFAVQVTWPENVRHLILKDGRFQNSKEAKIDVGDKACSFDLTNPFTEGESLPLITSISPSEKMHPTGAVYFDLGIQGYFAWNIKYVRQESSEFFITCGKYSKTWDNGSLEFQPFSDINLADFKQIVGEAINLGSEIVY